MSNNRLASFPRCITIRVPITVPMEEVGDYVTGQAHEALIELGGAVLPRSISLRPISAALFALTFETNNQFTYKTKDDTSEPDDNGEAQASETRQTSTKRRVLL